MSFFFHAAVTRRKSTSSGRLAATTLGQYGRWIYIKMPLNTSRRFTWRWMERRCPQDLCWIWTRFWPSASSGIVNNLFRKEQNKRQPNYQSLCVVASKVNRSQSMGARSPDKLVSICAARPQRKMHSRVLHSLKTRNQITVSAERRTLMRRSNNNPIETSMHARARTPERVYQIPVEYAKQCPQGPRPHASITKNVHKKNTHTHTVCKNVHVVRRIRAHNFMVTRKHARAFGHRTYARGISQKTRARSDNHT